jgi:hypothetical protein
LKKMELLPSNVPANNVIHASPKGKKRASTDDEYDEPRTPKKARRDIAEVSDDVNMGEVGEAGA